MNHFQFRVDDVSVNTDLDHLQAIGRSIMDRFSAVIMLAISPMVHDVSREPDTDHERAFPRKLSAMSDHRNFFRIQRGGLPDLSRLSFPFTLASHGLVHVDHRLLGREAQEMSIVMSCSLAGAKIFVPPFNKWNRDTESVCVEHGIELVKFEDGWRHVRYNVFDSAHDKWYLHTHDTSVMWLTDWFR